MHALATRTSDLRDFEWVELPIPEPAGQDIRVRVRAVAVNPVDTKIRASLGVGGLAEPRVLGWDAAGEIEAMGSDVSGFAIGDRVFYAGDLSRAGCNAIHQLVDARMVARMPSQWSFADAAALPLVTLTAWELLFERMQMPHQAEQSSGRLLIINGGGGVGSAAIPLAKAAGFEVVATASRPESIRWCRELGADRVINHRQALQPQCEALGTAEFPYIVSFYQPEAHWQEMGELLAPFGTIGLIVEPGEPLHLGDPLKAKCARIAWEFMAARSRYDSEDLNEQGRILAAVARRCDQGSFPKLMTRNLGTLDIATLQQAHRAMEQGAAYGKWVMTVEDR